MIPLIRNAFFRERETRRALSEFVTSGDRLSMGEQCAAFETAFAAYQGRRDAVLFNSGGSANLALLQSLRNLGRLEAGERVGFSGLTWATNVMPILQMGLVPVALDCRPDTLNTMAEHVDAEHVENRSLAAVFITNALGFAGDLDRIRSLCDADGVLLLEDSCEALGTELPAGRAGNFGLAATFSFFVGHHMSTIEGGMVVTDDAELAMMLRIVRANGWDRNLPVTQQHELRARHGVASELEAKYTFYDLAYNLRPTEITGFLGCQQLKNLPETVRLRGELYRRLEGVARENDDLVPIDHAHLSVLSPLAFPVLCRSAELRARYVAEFAGAGVEIRPMIAGNIQRQPFFRKYVGGPPELRGVDAVHERGFYCGLYPDMTEADLATITSCLLRK